MYKLPKVVDEFADYLLEIKGRSEYTVKNYVCDIAAFLEFLIKKKNMKENAVIKKVNEDKTIDVQIGDKTYRNVKAIDDTSHKVSDNEVEIYTPFEMLDIKFFDKITENDIEAFLRYCARHEKNSTKTRARKLSSLKTFFKFLKKKKWINADPTYNVDPVKIEKTIPRCMTAEEGLNLIESVDGKYKVRDIAILTFLLNCGLRVSELVNIDISDIHNDTLWIFGKGKKERVVNLNEACMKALSDYLEFRPKMHPKDKDALFISENGTRISVEAVQKMVKKNLAMIGRSDLTTHSCRHTAASLMLEGGADLKTIQELLGHSSLSTTSIYLHINQKQKKEAVAKNPLNNLLLRK